MKRVLAGLAAVVLAGPAAADIIDVGPFGNNISSVGGASGSDIYAQAFTATSDNIFILGGMYLSGGGNDAPAVRMDLWGTDGQGNPDENNILIAGPTYQQNFPDLTLVTVAGNVALVEGQRYFLVLNGMIDQTSSGAYGSTWSSPDDPYAGGWATWSNDLAASWSNPDGASWGTDWGFYVETVPGPGAIALFGIAGLLATRRRR